LGAVVFAAAVTALAVTAGSASAQPALVSPANGATFARDAAIPFMVDIPAAALDASIQISSSPATNASGALANPEPTVFGLTAGSPVGTYTWQPFEQASGTYYWQATSFVCETTAPFSCPGNEVSPVQSIVLTALPPPAPVSPVDGAAATVGASIKFVFTPNAQSEDTKLDIVFARSGTVGADGVLTQPSDTTADLTFDEGVDTNSNVSVPVPASIDSAGTIYWQPVRVNCDDNPTPPCNVAGPVSTLILKKKPPPPLHVQISGSTLVRIGNPRAAWTVACSEACKGNVAVRSYVTVGGKAVGDGLFNLGPTRFSIGTGQAETFHYTYKGTLLAQLTRAVSLHGAVTLDVIATASENSGGGSAKATRSIFVRPNPPPPPPAKPPPPPPTPEIIHDFSGNALAATAAIYGNPAQPANQFDNAPAGSHLVAIQLTLKGEGPGTVSDDVNADAALVGTDLQVYAPVFNDVAGCTNFDLGSFTLAPGQSEVGCVVFALPDGTGINRLTLTLTDGSVDYAQWHA
jgi:hypothetical protein